MMKQYDVFVIGAGSGGVRAARRASEAGLKTAISDGRELGGTCVNRGCVPKKLYSFASHYQEAAHDAQPLGLQGTLHCHWQTLQKNKNKEIKRLNDIYDDLLQKAGVTIYHHEAQLHDAHHVNCGGEMIEAKRIVIATGGVPRSLPCEGHEHSIVSDDVFHLPTLPTRMVVVGGGYIAVEMACIVHGLGVAVTMIHRGDALLQAFDHEIAAQLHSAMTHKGITVLTQSQVKTIEKAESHLRVTLTGSSSPQTIETDCVLVAIGRMPNTANLALNEVKIATDDGGFIKVNEHYQTSVPSVYAIGDVVGRMALTPVAIREAERLVAHWTGREQGRVSPPLNYEQVPTAVFSHPPLAAVGLTERQAQQRYGTKDVQVTTSRFKPLQYSLHRHQDMAARHHEALLKTVAHRDGRILGFHMLGADAAEIMQGLAIALAGGVTTQTVAGCIGIHPTTAEEWIM